MTSVTKGLRAVAVLEASKGIVSLLVGFGLHELIGQNLRQLAESMISHAHLNPASHFPSVFIHAASTVSANNMNLLAIGALVYALIRLVEAYGLWRGLLWTEWFALVSGAIYLPFEIYEIVFHPNILSVCVLLINILVVWYMFHVVKGNRKEQHLI